MKRSWKFSSDFPVSKLPGTSGGSRAEHSEDQQPLLHRLLAHPALADIVFNFLDLEDLDRVGMTSKTMQNALQNWTLTRSSHQKLFHSLFSARGTKGLVHCFTLKPAVTAVPVTPEEGRKEADGGGDGADIFGGAWSSGVQGVGSGGDVGSPWPNLNHRYLLRSRTRFNIQLYKHLERAEDARKHLLAMDPRSWRSNFRALGLFFKRLTCHLPTQARLEFISKFLRQVNYKHPALLTDPSNILASTSLGVEVGGLNDPTNPEDLLCSSRSAFAFSYMGGWEKSECLRALKYRAAETGLEKEIARLQASEYRQGSNFTLETTVRRQLYYGYWSEVSREDRAFWLPLLLSHFCPKDISAASIPLQQARLLYLFLGPLKSVTCCHTTISWAMWDEMELPLDGSRRRTIASFGDLAEALTVLLSAEFPQHHMYLLIKELFHCNPEKDEWDAQNKASLLILASKELQKYFLSLSFHDEAPDLAEVMVQMMFQAKLLELDLQDTFGLFREVLSSSRVTEKKDGIVEGIWMAISEQLQEAMLSGSSDNTAPRQTQIMESMSQYVHSLMTKAYSGIGGAKLGEANVCDMLEE